MTTLATGLATEDQAETVEQHRPGEQRELWFWSEIHEKTYIASELCSLSDDLIRQLLSEATSLSAQLHAVTGEINDKKAAGIDWNSEWYTKVRAKKNKTEEFKNLVSRELKHREKLAVSAAIDSSGEIAGLKRKVDSLKRKIEALDKKEANEKPQRKYEYEKRKKFYELVIDAIGKSAFDKFMREAAKSAGLLCPGRWVEVHPDTEPSQS